jgi:hypothetical protein
MTFLNLLYTLDHSFESKAKTTASIRALSSYPAQLDKALKRFIDVISPPLARNHLMQLIFSEKEGKRVASPFC